MNISARLQEIALGHATAAQARAIVGAALREGTPESVQGVYAALRAWVWKAVNGRRRDEELREWFDLLRRTGSFLKDGYAAHAERLQVLHELIYESISVSEVLPIQEIVKRLYVKQILNTLFHSPSRQMSRRRIRQRFNLREANLSRILNLMMTAGLIDRTTHGREASFRLTNLGADAARHMETPLPETFEGAHTVENQKSSDIRIVPMDVTQGEMAHYPMLIHKNAKEEKDVSQIEFPRVIVNSIPLAPSGGSAVRVRGLIARDYKSGYIRWYRKREVGNPEILEPVTVRAFPSNEQGFRLSKEIRSAS